MHKFSVYLLIFSFFWTLSLKLFGQEKDSLSIKSISSLKDKIDSIVFAAIENEAFPGCVIYASHGDSLVYFESYGYHTYDSITSVKKNDIYDLASITKIAGATLAIMKLYEEGLIDLDKPINEYVNGIGKKVGRITLREALAHQGGIYPWIPFHQVIRKKNGDFRAKDIQSVDSDNYPFEITDQLHLSDQFYEKRIKKLIKKSKVTKNPSYRYSGLFFYLVPELVYNLTGVQFEDYLDQSFYGPLEAETLGFNPLENYDLSRIAPTEVDTFFRMEPIHGKVHDEGAIMMRGVSGNAGLFGNAEDLATLMKMLLNYGKLDSLQLLQSQTVDLFTSAQYPNLNNRRGLGFDKPLLEYDSVASSVAKDASFRSFGHTGYTGTLVWADPENDLLFVFLTNRVYPTRNNGALYQLNVRPAIHQILYDHLKDEKP